MQITFLAAAKNTKDLLNFRHVCTLTYIGIVEVVYGDFKSLLLVGEQVGYIGVGCHLLQLSLGLGYTK